MGGCWVRAVGVLQMKVRCVPRLLIDTTTQHTTITPLKNNPPQASNAFNAAATAELRAIYAARGEDALAANLSRHLANMAALRDAKRSGRAWASEAWAEYAARTRSPEQRETARAAFERKRELGLIRERSPAPAAASAVALPFTANGGRGGNSDGAAGVGDGDDDGNWALPWDEAAAGGELMAAAAAAASASASSSASQPSSAAVPAAAAGNGEVQ